MPGSNPGPGDSSGFGPTRSLSAGQVLNQRYRIDALLGQGLIGAVYLGWDLSLNAPVALKGQWAQSPQAAAQFTQRARQMASLRHPHLPYVIDHFSVPGLGDFLVMEFIQGQDLGTVIRQARGGLPEWQVLAWASEICDALQYLHSQPQPIIHRDVKPANIRISPQGVGGAQAVLVDYGVALASDPDPHSTLLVGIRPAAGDLVVGNPFTAPEQYSGFADQRSDIYALGATLYLALTCGYNSPATLPLDSRNRQAGQVMPSPRQINPSLSTSSEAVILRAMDLSPQRRFQNADEMKMALMASTSSNAPLPATEVIQSVSPRTLASAGGPLPPTVQVQAPPPEAGHGGGYSPAGFYPQTPPPVRYVQAPPARSRNLAAALIFITIAICLLGGLVGGIGLYLLVFTPIPPAQDLSTATQPGVAIASLTATGSPTASQTSSPTIEVPLPTTAIVLPPATKEPTSTSLPTSTVPTLSPTPGPTPTPGLKPTWSPCAGTYPSRLHVGDVAYVSYNPPLSNRVRSQANTASKVLGFLQPGEKMDIIGGPVCSDQWIWWQVRSLKAGLTGWTAEGDLNSYWLVPVPK
jgi:hypothetical protein